MLVSYDNIAQAVYIELQSDATIAKTIKVTPETFVDVDAHGALIGVELLNPSAGILRKLAKPYRHPELTTIHLDKLQAAIAWRHRWNLC